MERAVTIAAALVGIGIAGIALSGKRGEPTDPSRPGSQPGDVSRPTKTGRIDDWHDPNRFDSLDGGMKKLATDLEKAAVKWHRSRPPHESFHGLHGDWSKFAAARISALETRQLRRLWDWLEEEHDSELHNYRQAIVMIWASREPDVVRARLLATAERHGFIGREVKTWRNLALEEISDNFDFFRVGHAMHDPQAAWEAFLKDEADPRMKYFVNAGLTLPDLFREFAARAPDEAWHLALTTGNEEHCRRMVEGFADGAPAGQDWERRARDLQQSLAGRGLEISHRHRQVIAERWIMENPEAALEWFATTGSGDALAQSDDPFGDEHVEKTLTRNEIAILLLTDMYQSHKDRSDDVIVALGRLASNGEDHLAAEFLGRAIGDHLAPMDTPLLQVIPKIPSAEARNELFLLAVRSIPLRHEDIFSHDPMPLAGPNSTLEAVRDLATRLHLTPEIRAQAEQAFRNVEAAELKALEEQKKRPRDHEDPFAPRR